MTLDRLDRAVCDLTSSASVAALRRIAKLAQSPSPTRAEIDQARDIRTLCAVAHGAMMDGLDAIEQDRVEDAARVLERALEHLTSVSELVDPVEDADGDAGYDISQLLVHT